MRLVGGIRCFGVKSVVFLLKSYIKNQSHIHLLLPANRFI